MNLLTKVIAKKIRKKAALPLEIGAAGLALFGTLAAINEQEKNDLTYARYVVDGKGKVSDNVRLVFLTDLHEKEFGEGNAQLIEMVRRADPDAVLIGGDMIIAGTTGRFEPKTEHTLHLCRALAKDYPVFYGNGNHEQRLTNADFRRELEAMGVSYLSDEAADWKYNISISGVDLEREQYKAFTPKAPDDWFFKRRMGVLHKEDSFQVLLAHSPLFIENYEKAGADLVLAGHFHGGTIRIAPEVGLMTPQYQFFNTNVVGERHFGATTMVISSGLGTHSVNIRINDKPQVVVVDIKK